MNSGQMTHEQLKEIQNTGLENVVHPPTVVDPSFSISKVIGMMSETDSYDVYHLEKGQVMTTNAREMIEVRDISKTTISSLLHGIKGLSKNDTVEKAATAMSHYRMRSFPVISNNQITGVVTAKGIVNLLSQNNLKWIKANSILTPNPIVLNKNESLAKARSLMITRRIDHVPILHKDKVESVLTSMHLLQALNPPQRIGRKELGMDSLRRFESNIGNFGSVRVPQCNTNDSINTVIYSMLKTDTSCCLLSLWDNLHGIITYKDILGLLLTKIPSQVPLYISGMPDDAQNADIVKTKFQKIISNLIKVYPEVEEARTSIKTIHNQTSKRKHFDVSVRIITPYKNYNYNELGWDLSQAFDTLGKRITKNLSKRNKKRWKTSIRKINKKEIF